MNSSIKNSTGRPQKLDQRDQRHLKGLAEGKNRFSVSKIVRDLNQSLSEPINSPSLQSSEETG